MGSNLTNAWVEGMNLPASTIMDSSNAVIPQQQLDATPSGCCGILEITPPHNVLRATQSDKPFIMKSPFYAFYYVNHVLIISVIDAEIALEADYQASINLEDELVQEESPIFCVCRMTPLAIVHDKGVVLFVDSNSLFDAEK